MDSPTYTFAFPESGGEFKPVEVIDHRQGKALSFSITVGDRPEMLKSPIEVPPLMADLIDLAVALYVADRMANRYRYKKRTIHLRLPLPVRDEFLQPEVSRLLSKLLIWYTGDNWTFEFSQRRLPRLSEVQRLLPFTDAQPNEVVLWSGGLAALAGLCNRIRNAPEHRYILFGTGSNPEVIGVQRAVYQAVSRKLPRNSLLLSQINIRLDDTGDFTGRKNKAPRIRGFAFLLLGSAKALLEGENRLHVYENGVGAINLAFAGGIHGLDHSRAVHPKSLYLVGKFVEALTGSPFEVINPFIFNTKGWMCEALLTYGLSDIVAETISCDTKPRERFDEKVRHCGACSSCLLRRQSLAAAGIADETNYASILSESVRETGRVHYRAVKAQIARLENCLADSDPWAALCKAYPEVGEAALYLSGRTPAEVRERILNLLRCYVGEWKREGRTVGWELGDWFSAQAAA